MNKPFVEGDINKELSEDEYLEGVIEDDNDGDSLHELTDDDDDIDIDDEHEDGNLDIKTQSDNNSMSSPNIIDDNTSYYDSDEDEDEEEFDKLNIDMTQELLSQHPEYITHNIKEVNALCKVVKDSNGVIIDKLHRTLPFITRYERAKILGERSKQLTYPNVEPMIKIPPNIIDSYEIAKMEYNANVIPYIIKRNIPSGICEYWKFSDLEKILFE